MQNTKVKLSKEIINYIDSYKNKSLFEINKIIVKWAYGTNKKYLSKYYKLIGLKDYSIYLVNTKELINKADFGEMGHTKLKPDILFNGIDERDFRIAKLLEHWGDGGFIDPPEIFINNLPNISFNDGRHRTIVAFHLGEKEIPVIIHNTLIEKISSITKLNKKLF
ncbi:MAG: hypothetical protein L3J07_02570 [Candidatus Magasanikbacteria bacterium]|nr:hypothetical protein [Candidatus Magasanikbacteria bacterium]